jgi:hypothetical protein
LIAGEGKLPTKEHLVNLAKNFSMKQPNKLIDEVKESISNWGNYAQQSGVGKESQKNIQKVIDTLLNDH